MLDAPADVISNIVATSLRGAGKNQVVPAGPRDRCVPGSGPTGLNRGSSLHIAQIARSQPRDPQQKCALVDLHIVGQIDSIARVSPNIHRAKRDAQITTARNRLMRHAPLPPAPEIDTSELD